MTIAQFETEVPADHPALPGHFPGVPVVPAALLLGIVHSQAARRLGFRSGPSRWVRLRFVHPLRPEQPFRVMLDGDAQAFSFQIVIDAGTGSDRQASDPQAPHLPIARGSCRHGALE